MGQTIVTGPERRNLRAYFEASRRARRTGGGVVDGTTMSSPTSASGTRPFRILGLQQVALGAPDKTKLQHLWTELLGVPAKGSYRSERENVDEDILTVGLGPFAVEIDLMQPIDPEKSPKVHVPPLNHIGLWVDDLRAAVAWLTEKGLRFAPGGIRPGAAGHDVVFVHPKGSTELPFSGEGVLLELVQAPDDVISAYERQKLAEG
jgi:lactoylglutathione lyase